MAGKDPGKGAKTAATDRRWHAVSVKPGPRACTVADAGQDRRWLSREAPALPLPGCTSPDTCRCTYRHHEDRRDGEGRRAQEKNAFSRPAKVSTERRKLGTRRAPRDSQ
jgi:hypothetical protein